MLEVMTADSAPRNSVAEAPSAARWASIDELLERAHVVALPLRVPFRGVQVREALLFDAPFRWAEWAPFLEYEPEEASRWLRAALNYGYSPAPDVANPWVPVNATVPAVDVRKDPEVIDALMQRYPGCTTVKVKVAQKDQRLSDDVARVSAVREWFAEAGIPDPKVRLDANGAWSVSQALEAIDAITANGPLDYVEQPCATAGELAEVRRQLGARAGSLAESEPEFSTGSSPVRIAADECIRKSADPLTAVTEVIDADACDVVVLKVPPLGGVARLLDIARTVAPRGVAVTVSSALDTGVGLGAGLEAAARLPEVGAVSQAAGLATGSLFVEDLAPRPIVNGRIQSGPLVPDATLLREFAASGKRKDWWFDRLKRAYQHL